MPKITHIIILICVLVFLGEYVAPPDVLRAFVFSTATFSSKPWTLVASIFLHINVVHLFLNMVVLFFFGSYTEQKIGRKKFIGLFFIAGILANAIYLLERPGSSISIVGASSAIASIIGVLTAIKPRLLVFFFFIRMRLWVITVLIIMLSIAGLVSGETSIAYMGHLTGLLFGLVYGYHLKTSLE